MDEKQLYLVYYYEYEDNGYDEIKVTKNTVIRGMTNLKEFVKHNSITSAYVISK